MNIFVRFFKTKPGTVILNGITMVVSKIRWPQWYPLHDDELNKIREMLIKDYYVILTRYGNHLSTVAINVAHKALTGKKGYYGHVLMNLEDEVRSDSDFRLVEAIGTGSQFSTFDQVFGTADSVAILKPANLKLSEWTAVLDKATTLVGKPYDTVYDMYDDSRLSCVELVRDALSAYPKYNDSFSQLEDAVNKYHRLDPQMFYECADFTVVCEMRRGWFTGKWTRPTL